MGVFVSICGFSLLLEQQQHNAEDVSLLFALPTKELPLTQSIVLILRVLGHKSPFVLLRGCTSVSDGGLHLFYAVCEVQAALKNLVSCNIPGGTGCSENSSNKHPHHGCEDIFFQGIPSQPLGR